MHGNRTKKIALMDAMTQESELIEEDIIALDPKVKAGIRKHYKSKVFRSTGGKPDLVG